MTNRTQLALVAALGAAGAAGPASAGTPCSTLPAPIYGQGGSAHTNFLAKIGAKLAALAAPQTLIYQDPGACVGVNSIIADTAITGTAKYWTAAGEQLECDLPITGQKIDFAAAGVYPDSCQGITGLPAGLGDFTGVINSWNVLVPVESTQQSVSSEALYFIFGFGAAGQVAPWTDETQLYVRNATSAVQINVAKAAGIPSSKVLGVDTKTNQKTVEGLANSPKKEAAIGFTSGEVADANRATVRTLAYQHVGQTCGYWPDSDANAFDKIDVRNGQYFLWSPTHFYVRVDAGGQPSDPKVKEFVGWFTGAIEPPAGVPVLDVTIDNGNIPKCAMNVDRSADSGPLVSFQPDAPCGCYYEKRATGATTCATCGSDSDCTGAAKKCRLGYCEVK